MHPIKFSIVKFKFAIVNRHR